MRQPINFTDWLAEYGPTLKPPVGNREMFPGGDDFVVMVVGGPNQRTDYHVDPYEEVFYQVKGDMHVNVQAESGPARIDIHEGDMWVLPRSMPHSPQRPEPGSVGLVFERIREPGTPERFRWYCPGCNAIVHDVELQVRDIVADLPPVFQAFYDSKEARTCPNCGALHPGKG
jgi:3-hydroxyanthranilate 3,4-dioxygenase